VITMPMFLFAVLIVVVLVLGYRWGVQMTARRVGWGNVRSGWRRFRTGRL